MIETIIRIMRRWYNIAVDKKTGTMKTKRDIFPQKPPLGKEITAVNYWLRRPVEHSNYDNHYEYKCVQCKPDKKPKKHGGWEIYNTIYI